MTSAMFRVYITGGQFKRRPLSITQGIKGLRPTTSRVREALFNWLRGHLAGWHCLDAFAGTGVLGFESLSQGAAFCTMIDQSHRVVTALKRQADAFSVSKQTKIIKANAIDQLAQWTDPVDLIFLDPPFATELLAQSIQAVLTNESITSNTWIYIEMSKRQQRLVNDSQLMNIKYQSAGDVVFGLWHKP